MEQIKITAEYIDTPENLSVFATANGWDGQSDLAEFVTAKLNSIVTEIISDPVGKMVDSQFEAARIAKREEEKSKIAERLAITSEVIPAE